MNKETQFIDWLCGAKIKFPFFRNMPQVALPDGYDEKKDEMIDQEVKMHKEKDLFEGEEDSDEDFSNTFPVAGI